MQVIDDLKDWSYMSQLATNAFEHRKSALMFAERLADSLDFYQETVMGMGYAHTSNVTQRLSTTVLLRWYQIFKELDAPSLKLAAERKRRIKCWISTCPPE